MHHIKQWGITIQIWPFRWWQKRPSQQAKSSTTDFGITHETPNKPKSWTTDLEQYVIIKFTIALHIQHQSIILIFLFLKLSIVKILRKATVHTKKGYSWRGFWSPYDFPRKGLLTGGSSNIQKMVIGTNLKALFLIRFLAYLIFPSPPNSKWFEKSQLLNNLNYKNNLDSRK